MSNLIISPYVRTANRYHGARQQVLNLVRGGWKDEDGFELSVEKMLFLGAAVVVGLAAIAFAISTFNAAKANVPTPTPAAP